MRQVTDRRLWLGNAGDLWEPATLVADGIMAVVELADSEKSVELPREIVRCRFPLSDGGDNPPWLLRLAADTVAALIRADVPTAVCCSAGVSRSVCVVAAATSLIERQPLSHSLPAVVGDGPADVSPGLVVQMQAAIGG